MKTFLPFLGFCCFCHFGVANAGVKLDAQTLRDVNAGVKNVDNIKLVLKKFFTSPEDTRQINRDMVQFAKTTKRTNWHFEARGNEFVLKSKKKILFKFRLITEGKKVSDFTFNFNGRKFAINSNRSYSWHKRKIEDTLGLSRQSLLETLVIKKAHAFIFLAALALTAAGTTIWSRNSQAATTPGGSSPSSSALAGSPGLPASTTSPTSVDVPFSSSCDDDEKMSFYNRCTDNEWRIFEPSLDGDQCTQEEYCNLTLDHTHFEKMDLNRSDKKYPGLSTTLKEKCKAERVAEGVDAQTAQKMCDRAGYLVWHHPRRTLNSHPQQKSLGAFLQFITRLTYDQEAPLFRNAKGNMQRHPVAVLGASFDMNGCEKEAKEPPQPSSIGEDGNGGHDVFDFTRGWGMKEEWAKKYCKAAKNHHEGCANAAKQCSDTPLSQPTQPPGGSPTTGTPSDG